MSFYVTVSEGQRTDQARPVLAVSDPRMVQAMLGALTNELAAGRLEQLSRRDGGKAVADAADR